MRSAVEMSVKRVSRSVSECREQSSRIQSHSSIGKQSDGWDTREFPEMSNRARDARTWSFRMRRNESGKTAPRMKRLTSLALVAIIALPVIGCGGGRAASLPPAQSAALSLSILPPTAAVPQGGTLTFSVTATGSNNTAVKWSVTEGAAGGSVTSSGTYTSPNTPGTYHVNAVSQADTELVATATITVPAVTISVSPRSRQLVPARPKYSRQMSKAQ